MGPTPRTLLLARPRCAQELQAEDISSLPAADAARAQHLLAQVIELTRGQQAGTEPELDPEAREGDIGEVYGTQRDRRRRRAAAAGEPEVAGGGRVHWHQAGRHRAALLRARPGRRVQQQRAS